MPPALYTSQAKQLLASQGYDIAWNVMNDSLQINGGQFTEAMRSEMYCLASDLEIPRGMRGVRDVLTLLGQGNKVHPVWDYLRRLSYDGRDHIGEVASYFVDTHDMIVTPEYEDNVFSSFLRRFMVGAVARVAHQASLAMTGKSPHENTPQNVSLILGGKQGIGKSYFVQWLAGGLKNYYTDSQFNPKGNNTPFMICNTLIWEFAEIQNLFTKNNLAALKAMLTVNSLQFKLPYGQTMIHKSPITSVIGTFNPTGALFQDQTGNRRWGTVILDSIDHSYADNYEPDDLWAQAVHEYYQWLNNPDPRKVEPWAYNDEEKQMRDSINGAFTQQDTVADVMSELFVFKPNNTNLQTKPIFIAQVLNAMTNIPMDACSKDAARWLQSQQYRKMGNPPSWRGLALNPEVNFFEDEKLAGIMPDVLDNIRINADKF